MKANITKICVICGQPFQPDCRTVTRQTVCDNLSCRQQRKRQAQRRWCQQNPDYFKGRYPILKDQIRGHRPPVRRAAPAEPPLTLTISGIQDELTLYKNKYLKIELFIQDKLTCKISST
jgi:hypothetical protein